MKTTSPKLILLLAFSSFLICGLFNGSIGPVFSELALRAGTTISAVGGVITFLFLGALIAQLIAGPIVDNLGLKGTLVAAMLLLSIGIAGFTFAHSLGWIYFFFFILGLGQGAQVLTTNIAVSDASKEKNTTYLNLLHFFFGLGAFCGPAIVSLTISLSGSGLPIHWIASCLYLLVAIAYLFVFRNTKPGNVETIRIDNTKNRSLYRSPLLWAIGLLMLVYVGSEFGLGNWSTTFMGVANGMTVKNGALVTSAYWGFFMLGRLSGTFTSRKLTILNQLAVAIFGALACGIAFALLINTSYPLITALVAIGFFLGTIFPTMMAFTSKAFPLDQGKAVGLVSAMSSIGGLCLPLVDGIFLENHNAVGFAVFNVAILITVAITYLLARRFLKGHSVFLS